MKNRLFREHQAKDCQDVEKLRRICCEENRSSNTSKNWWIHSAFRLWIMENLPNSQWLHNVLISISLLLCGNCFTIHVCTSFLDANTTYHSTVICNQFPGASPCDPSVAKVGNLLAAECWLLLDATDCRGKLRSSKAAIAASYSCWKLTFRDGRLMGVYSLSTSMQNLGWQPVLGSDQPIGQSIPERSSTGV